MSTNKCPVCGSDKLEKILKKNIFPIPYGQPVEYKEHFDHCLNCDEYGDYSGANDAAIIQAIENAKKSSVATMLDKLNQKGYRFAYIERALGLPQRTTARWKKGEVSASSVALMRVITTYPWILEVADYNYDSVVAKTKLCEEAIKTVHEALMPISKEAEINLTVDPSKFHFNADYRFFPSIKIEA